MDVFGLLKEDHRKVAILFQDLEDTPEREPVIRQRLFADLKSGLTLLADGEEAYFYPVLEGSAETQALVFESRVEHWLVKTLLIKLEADSKALNTSGAWSAKLKVLRDIVVRHVRREEWELFRKARKEISAEVAQSIASDIAAFKAEALLLQM
jgi:hypothetical protein